VAAVVALTAVGRAMDPNRDVSQYVRDAWGSEQGLPPGPIYAIAQTPDGYLWLGSERGLVRFDGVTFTLFPPAIPGEPQARTVLGLETDSSGDLWVRVSGPSLLRYRDGRFTRVTSDPAVPVTLVTAMSRGRDGRLLLSSMWSGTIRDRRERFELLAPVSALPRSVVIALADGTSGDVWLGTRDVGLVRLQAGKATNIVAGLPDRKVNSLLPGSDADMLVGTDRGVVRWDGAALTATGVPAALAGVQALAMIRDRESNVWVGTAGGDVLRVTAGSVARLPPAKAQSRGAVTALFEDRDGNVWIGSAHGLERLRDSSFITYRAAQGLPSDSAGPIHVDGEGRTWFAPPEGGLYWLKGNRVERVPDGGAAGDVIYSIAGSGGDIWLGRQRGGLTHLAPAQRGWTATSYTQAQGLAQNSVYVVLQSRSGAVWAGTLSGGVSVFEAGRFTTFTTANGLASNTITSMAEASDGRMWLGTPGGVSAFTAGKWESYTVAHGLPSNDVTSLTADRDGVVWVGTSAGVGIISGGRVEKPRIVSAGLPDSIAGIAADGRGWMWVATLNGVLRVDRDKLLRGDVGDGGVREYGLLDGLYSVEGVRRQRSVVADGARIWFSLGHGLSMIDPTRPAGGSMPAITHVVGLSADGTALGLGGKVRVPAGSHRLTFSYTGLSLSVPERVRFRYRLDGFDRDWSAPVTAREAIYTNLAPGPYRFRVMSSNSEGQWTPTESAVDISIAPQLWQTTWFRLVCFVALVLGAAGLYRLRMHQIARQLNLRFEERLAERTRIAQDLHDTLLQGFVSASMQLHVAADRIPPESPARPGLDRVLTLMARVIDEGRNAVRGLRSTAETDSDLEQVFCRMQQELGIPDAVEFRVIVEGRVRPLHPVTRDEVYRIGREALSNAVRHSGATTIEVEIDYTPSQVRLRVRDNGCGMPDTVLRSGRDGHWGLAGMRERADRIGARLKLWSRASAGTEIELVVPAQAAFRPAAAAAVTGDKESASS
jgi:ligand-binding sensor domain-containing protein/signal transduction histidine kinase